MKRIASFSLLTLLSLLLVACGGNKKPETPVVPEPEIVVPAEPEIIEPVKNTVNHAIGNPAIMAIWERAEAAREAGDLEGAISHLERAIRINPVDAVVWTRLAELRLKQGKYIPAENIAIKSNKLNADADRVLSYRNWRIIAKARELNGDSNGAQQALQQAQAYK